MKANGIGSPHSYDRPLVMESLILASCLLVLLLSYLATIRNSYMPSRWQVGCCGREFWWSAVGAAAVLVGCAIALFLKRTWAFILATLMSTYVIYYSLSVAIERWNDYSSINKAYGFGQALLPVYRPLSVLLSVVVIALSMRALFRGLDKR